MNYIKKNIFYISKINYKNIKLINYKRYFNNEILDENKETSRVFLF